MHGTTENNPTDVTAPANDVIEHRNRIYRKGAECLHAGVTDLTVGTQTRAVPRHIRTVL